MQEFQYSNNNKIDDSLSDKYRAKPSPPSYHKMKDKLMSTRKQNYSQVATSILSNEVNKPRKEQVPKTKSVDDEIEVSLTNHNIVSYNNIFVIMILIYVLDSSSR
jgi:hypothetical protein